MTLRPSTNPSRSNRRTAGIAALQNTRSDAVSGVDSSTFGEGVRLLPPEIQADVRRLYRVLRTIDDLVDGADPRAEERIEAIDRWAHAEPADSPEIRVLDELAWRYPFPHDAIAEFCDGMRHDISRQPIQTERDLERYCHQAGGSVGVMLTALLGASDPRCEEKMATLGRAMQRTNILRDIDEDYAHGRVYIPQTLIDRFGFPAPGQRERLLRDQIACADALYEEGAPALEMLETGRQAMALATALYREILRQIERNGYGRKAGSVTIPHERRLELAAQAAATSTPAPDARTRESEQCDD